MDETQRHELGYAAGLLLYFPQQCHVVGELRRGFAVAEHHGGRGGDCQIVGRGDYFNPLVNGDAPRGDAVAQFLVQHFGGRSGQAAHAGGFQPLQVFADGAAGTDGAVQHFLGGKAVDVHLRQGFLDGGAEADVQIALHLGRQAGLDAYLGGAVIPRFLGAADDFLDGEVVALLFAEIAAEGAEAATLDADIGEIDVAVDDVGGDVAHGAAAQFVGH